MSSGIHDHDRHVSPRPDGASLDFRHEIAWSHRWTGSRKRHVVVLSALIVLGALSMPWDIELSRAMVRDRALHGLHSFLKSIEPFGQPTAIVMTALAIALCDPFRRPLMPRFLAASIGAGIAADLVKLLVARARPNHHDLAGSVLSTFQGAFPGWGLGSKLQSCPSAHTATAVGFCLALSTLFPGARRLFYVAASLVALQRIETGAHFLSDTFWGAAVGYATCLVVFRPELLGDWFDKKERARWKRTGTADVPCERLSNATIDDEPHRAPQR